jgi:hypothetical protein
MTGPATWLRKMFIYGRSSRYYRAGTATRTLTRGERLALFRSTFTTDSEMQLVMLSVAEIDPDGLVSHISLYDDGALDDAVADLEARYIGGEGADARIENTATRAVLDAVAHWQSGELDFDDAIAENVVRFDTRRSVATPTLEGRAAFIENVRAIYDVFDSLVLEPLAIRGDRVALFRVTLSRDGFAATMLGVYETDERGLVVRGTSFDDEDLDLALDELEDRFVAGEGAARE